MKPLAFIIITYNRPADMFELLENIRDLNEAKDLLQEVIIVNNASTEDYSAVKKLANSISNIEIKYIESKENLGVARGRNFAVTQSLAPILILLDDDAVLQNKDALINLVKEFETASNTQRTKAIVSFKVLYYDTLEMQKNALPHKKYEKYKDKHYFETYYYAGGAHAIKREVLDIVGNYPEDFFYGMEEYDLSYRVINNGYSIVYTDKIVMLHKESPLGRPPKSDKLRMMWVNKSKVAWRYLPKIYFYSTALMWSLQYLKITGLDIKGYFKGWREINNMQKAESRRTINESTIQYLKSLKARLWY